MIVKRIICLANSRKLSGRCVAGKEWAAKDGGGWVRPVSDRPSEEVSEHERHYKDGKDPQVLDIIDVPLERHHPKSYQSENWLLDPKSYWVFVERARYGDLAALQDNPGTLWINGSSTYNGLNDRVSHADAQQLHGSLYLIRLAELKLRVFAPGADFGNPKRRVQADFAFAGSGYRLWVTDPMIEKQYLARPDGEHEIGESFATVSLGEPHEGYCYKLLAALIASRQ